MKKTVGLKMCSTVLALSLMLSSVVLGNSVQAAKTVPNDLYLDSDVDLDVYSNDCWETIYEDGTLNTEFTKTEIKTSGEGTKLLSLKQSILDGISGKLDRITFVLENEGTFDTKIIAGKNGNGHIIFYSKNWTSGMYKKLLNDNNEMSLLPDGSSDGWMYVGTELSPVFENKKVGVTIKYGSVIKVMISAGDDFDNVVATFTVDGFENIPELYLTEKSNLTNLRVITKQKVNYFADWNAFSKKHSAIISAADVTIADEYSVRNAISDFESFDEALKDNKYDTYLKLCTFLEKIESLKSGRKMDLSDMSLPVNWETIKGTMKNVNRDSEGSLILSGITQSSEGSLLLIAPKRSSLSKYGESIGKYSYEVRTSNDKMGLQNAFNLVYQFNDSNNFKYLCIWYYEPWGGWIAQNYSVKDGIEAITETSTGLNFDFSGWVKITANISEEGYINLDIEGSSKKQSLRYQTTDSTRMILSSIRSVGESIKYRNFAFYGVNSDDIRSENKIISNFKYTYNEVLNLSDNMIFINYETTVNEALEDYGKLHDYSKGILAPQKAKLDYIKDVINAKKIAGESPLPERESGDYSLIEDDFESGFKIWSNYNAPSSEPDIVYDEEKQSKVLKLSGTTTIGPNSFSYPKNAFVKKISFKYKTAQKVSSAWYPLNFIAGWVDSDNYNILKIYRINSGNTEGIWDVNLTPLKTSVAKGVSGLQSLPDNYSLSVDYDFRWLDVTMRFETTGTAYITISDGNNTDIITMKSLVNGRPALRGIGASSDSFVFSHTAYYDDLKIELAKGDYEQKTKITKPTVYYTGNTAVCGDDVVTLQGEELYDTVSKAYIVKIADDAASALGYVKQMDFSSMGTESQYIVAEQVSKVWNRAVSSSESIKLNIYQHSDMQLKFVIPKELGKGIFAVKLEGFDEYSDLDDSVILINIPKVSLALGTDGTSVKPGGILKVTGENIAPYHVNCDPDDFIDDKYQTKEYLNKNVRAALIKNGTERYIFSENDARYKLEVVAEQYIRLYIPNDFNCGEYELMVYNGYGDNSCWSMPLEKKVIVAASPYESWPDRVFNVKDYGATGDREQNATPFVINAITAVSENGGGVLYFPKGIYNIIHSIVIPEKVQVIGDGLDKSILLWTPDQWAINNCPTYLCGFSGNVSFKNLGIYASRLRNGFANFESTKNENVYIENCRFFSNPWTGSPTAGGWTGYSEEYSTAELRMMIEAESSSDALISIEKTVNFRLENTSVSKRFAKPISYQAEYLNFENCYITEGWAPGSADYAVYEKCEWEASTCGATGRSVIYYGCYFHDVVDNNKELWVADGSPTSTGGDVGLVIKKDISDRTGCTYYLQNSYGKQENDWKGWQIYISDGQGIGQVREITYNNAEKLVISSPFAVEPISQCRVIIRSPREDMFFVNNYYKNGLASGFFGGFANVIYNSNIWEYTSDIYQEARFGDMLMYLTYQNGYYFDSYQMHSYGSGHNDRSDFSYLQFLCDSGANHMQNFTIRNNTFEGYTFWLVSSVNDGIRGITFDKNIFNGLDYAIEKYPTPTVMGIMMYKNIEDGCISLNKTEDNKKDMYGSYRYYVYADGENSDSYVGLIGDVNGDGKISLKDSTLIKLHLSGLLEFTDEQLIRADVFKDGNITMRDSTAIRYFLCTGKFPSNSNSSDGDEYFDIVC